MNKALNTITKVLGFILLGLGTWEIIAGWALLISLGIAIVGIVLLVVAYRKEKEYKTKQKLTNSWEQ